MTTDPTTLQTALGHPHDGKKETTMTTATICTDTACPIPARHETFAGHTPEDTLRKMGLTPATVAELTGTTSEPCSGSHDFMLRCRRCGAKGSIHLSIAGADEEVSVVKREAIVPGLVTAADVAHAFQEAASGYRDDGKDPDPDAYFEELAASINRRRAEATIVPCTCEGEFIWACGPECSCWHHTQPSPPATGPVSVGTMTDDEGRAFIEAAKGPATEPVAALVSELVGDLRLSELGRDGRLDIVARKLDAIVAAARAEGLDGLTVAMVADAIHPEGQGPTIDCCMGSTVESLYPPDEAARLHRKHHEEAATRFLAYLADRARRAGETADDR